MAELQTSVREPQWLADRRSRAAELAAALDLPQFKGTPGWEFTSLAKLSLDAFAAAPQAERETLRTRLLDYFALTGNDDPRVAAARRRLAMLLY